MSLNESEIKVELITLAACVRQANRETDARIAAGRYEDGMALLAIERSVDRLWAVVNAHEGVDPVPGRGMEVTDA